VGHERLVVPMAPMMVMVAPRPEVEIDAWAVVAAISMTRTVQMSAVPVAPVAHLFDASALTRYWFEVSCHAARRRSLNRCREEPKHKGCS